MAIRYDHKLLDEIRRTVKNYQAKRQRVLAKGGEIIPDPSSVSSFLNDYTDRRALLRDLAKLKRYSQRGAEEIVALESGVTTTRYELSELKRQVATAKRNITIEMKRAGDWDKLQPIARSYFEHKQAQYTYLSRPVAQLSSRQLKTYRKIAKGESELDKKQQTFYENIHSITNDLTYGLPEEITSGFKDALNKLSMRQLTDLMTTDPYMRSLLDYYTVMQAGGQVSELQDKIQAITEYINEL